MHATYTRLNPSHLLHSRKRTIVEYTASEKALVLGEVALGARGWSGQASGQAWRAKTEVSRARTFRSSELRALESRASPVRNIRGRQCYLHPVHI